MGADKFNIFGKTKTVEAHFDEFLDTISQGSILFRAGINIYLDKGAKSEDFETKLKQIDEHESAGDRLRRTIENEMYTLALIPDFRGDVLNLLEELDYLLNVMEEDSYAICIESPQFSSDLHGDLRNLAEQSTDAVEAVVLAARAFLRDVNAVRDHLHKVMLFEKEADQVALKLKRQIFSSSLPLAEKTHLCRFVEKIDLLADRAEDVADWLSIYTIKRMD